MEVNGDWLLAVRSFPLRVNCVVTDGGELLRLARRKSTNLAFCRGIIFRRCGGANWTSIRLISGLGWTSAESALMKGLGSLSGAVAM